MGLWQFVDYSKVTFKNISYGIYSERFMTKKPSKDFLLVIISVIIFVGEEYILFFQLNLLYSFYLL